MAAPESDIVTLLKSKPEVTSTVVGTNIFNADQVPQSFGPGHESAYMTVQRIGGVSAQGHDGHAGIDDGQFQIDIFAKDKDAADSVYNGLSPIQNYSGAVGGRFVNHFDVTLPADLTEPPKNGRPFAACHYSVTLGAMYTQDVTDWA